MKPAGFHNKYMEWLKVAKSFFHNWKLSGKEEEARVHQHMHAVAQRQVPPSNQVSIFLIFLTFKSFVLRRNTKESILLDNNTKILVTLCITWEEPFSSKRYPLIGQFAEIDQFLRLLKQFETNPNLMCVME